MEKIEETLKWFTQNYFVTKSQLLLKRCTKRSVILLKGFLFYKLKQVGLTTKEISILSGCTANSVYDRIQDFLNSIETQEFSKIIMPLEKNKKLSIQYEFDLRKRCERNRCLETIALNKSFILNNDDVNYKEEETYISLENIKNIIFSAEKQLTTALNILRDINENEKLINTSFKERIQKILKLNNY